MQNALAVLKAFGWTVLIVGLAIGGYVGYRYAVNPSPAQLTNITSIADLPPTICRVTTATFEGATSGSLYISDGMMRTTARIILSGGQEKTVNIIFSDENNGTIHTWFEGDTTGVMGTDQYAERGFAAPDGLTECSPWWFPTKDVFSIPVEILFPAK